MKIIMLFLITILLTLSGCNNDSGKEISTEECDGFFSGYICDTGSGECKMKSNSGCNPNPQYLPLEECQEICS